MNINKLNDIRVLLSQSDELDHYHVHPDSKTYTKRSVCDLVDLDRSLYAICKDIGKLSQHWIFIDLDDFRQDAVFIHTRNRNSIFPKEFSKGNLSRFHDDWVKRIIKQFAKFEYICTKQAGCRVLVAIHNQHHFA